MGALNLSVYGAVNQHVPFIIPEIMANRTKRRIIYTTRREVDKFYTRLLQEGKARHAQQKIDREQEREYNRNFIRFWRKGIPNGVLNRIDFPFLELIYSFRPNWVRSLRPWPLPEVRKKTTLRRQLAQHLFAKYTLPVFMHRVWDTCDPVEIDWYIHLGKGGSIRTAPHVPLSLTKRMGHFFTHAPDDLDPWQALRYGQILGIGGTEEQAIDLLQTRLGNRQAPPREPFIRSLINWMVSQKVSGKELSKLLVSYIFHLKYDREHVLRTNGTYITLDAPNPGFQIKGRSLAKLEKEAWKWREIQQSNPQRLHIPFINRIGSFEYTLTVQKGLNVPYRIIPLLSEMEVKVEGQKQGHCVASYIDLVKRGKTSIWSLQSLQHDNRPDRILTIQVNPDLSIVQVRGRFNRSPNQWEQSLIRRWAQQQDLKY